MRISPRTTQFRDFPLENSVLDQTMEWLPYYDPDFDVMYSYVRLSIDRCTATYV